MLKVFQVHVSWDEEALVWYVSESDVPGLNAEAATLDEMQVELRQLIPRLLSLNGVIQPQHSEVPWELVSRHSEKIRAAG